MSVQTIGFIGAPGMLGRPVALAFLKAGWQVKALVRNLEKAKKSLPPEVAVIVGDIRDPKALSEVCTSIDLLYLNLSVDPSSRQKDYQPEREGLLQILEMCRQTAVSRIVYLSSLAQRYQGMNGFSWWAFALKQTALWRIQECGIPHLIFLPSNFMETIPHKLQMGNWLMLVGKGKYANHYIAAADYAEQVVRAIQQIPAGQNKQYIVQGLEGFTPLKALQVYQKNCKSARLKILRAPLWFFHWSGKISPQADYGAHIIEALNEYPEVFEAGDTWVELGKPATTLAEFAKQQ